ncbi:tetratricopeptide repeat protein [Parabacteroides goldsteinii]|uniref:tetratricopeptide repeat protein n=1 Tax=Parabacteroides goldsteinii TaxID=328812 RepID=UPI003AB44EEE
MKNILCLLFFSIIFFTGCQNELTERQLINKAETLLEIKPDSAYLLLDSITMADNLSDKLLARWCMLYGKAADKVVKDMPYVSQLLRARAWYKKYGTPYEQAQIGLFLGRSYVEDREYMKAMDAYTQALDVAEKAKEYNVAGYICSYMGDLYELKGFFQETFDKYNQSADYFLKAGNKRSYALALKFMAQTLAFEDSCSLALDYLLKADSIVTSIQDSGAISAVANGLGNVYRMLGDMENAEMYLLKALEADSLEKATDYSALSKLYIDMGDLDKARLCLEEPRKMPITNPYIPISILYAEYEIEKKSGNTELALSILEQYAEKADSIYNATIHLDVLDAEKRYNHVLLLNENARLHNNNLIGFVIIVGIVSIGLLLGIVVLFYYNKKTKMLYEQEVKLKKNEERISALSYEMEKKKKEIILQESIQDSESKLSSLKENIVNIEKELSLLKEEKIKNAAIVKKIMKLSTKIVAGNKESLLTNRDWRNFMDLINQTYRSFDEFVSDNSYGLTPAEIQYCYLSFLQLDISSEAVLLNINPESISKRRLRIRQKLGYVGSEVSFFECICKCLFIR